jgi:hypothetical protein
VRLSGLTSKALVAEALVLRVRPGSDPVRHATKTAIVTLARRVQAINTEIAVLDCHIDTLVRATAPGLVYPESARDRQICALVRQARA